MTSLDLNLNIVESMLTDPQDRYTEVPIEREPVDIPAKSSKIICRMLKVDTMAAPMRGLS